MNPFKLNKSQFSLFLSTLIQYFPEANFELREFDSKLGNES